MIEFRMLGTLELRASDGRELHSLLAQPKRVALLAFLCAARPSGFHRRDTLLGYFWPEAPQDRARGSLRNALHVLRQSLGPAAVVSRGDEEVALDFSLVSCDVARFNDAVASESFEQAVELYRGDLLEGFFLNEVPEFSRWLEGERARLREAAARAASEAARERAAVGDTSTAVKLARRAVDLAEHDERALRALIRLLESSGDRVGALRAYDAFARRLAEELEAEPEPGTRELVERVRRGALPTTREANAETAASGTHSERAPAPTGADGVVTRAESISPHPHRSSTVFRRVRAVIETRGVAALAAATFLIAIAARGLGDVLERNSREPPPGTRTQLTFSGTALLASISPDGQFLAYVTPSGDSQHVVVQEIAGGAETTVLTVPAVRSIDWSPDSRRLLAAFGSGAVVVPRLGGAIQPVPLPEGFPLTVFAAWLPDGEHVSVHGASSRRLWIVSLATGDTLRSLPVAGRYDWLFEAAWSPDGRAVVVASQTADPVEWAIHIVSANGRTRVVLADTTALGSLRWSRDGRHLYFADGFGSIRRVPAEPPRKTRRESAKLVHRPIDMFSDYLGRAYFTVSSDGRRLTYSKGLMYSNLWSIERRAGAAPQLRKLTQGTAFRWSPAVSPDGRWVAFAEEAHGSSEIYRMPSDSGAATRLTFGARARHPGLIAWSPDGKEIAFVSLRRGRVQLRVADVAHGRHRALGDARGSFSRGELSWAPARRIAYQSRTNRNVHFIDPVTGHEQTLVQDTLAGWFFGPTYSSDGMRLAVVFNRPGADYGTWVFDLRDSSSIRIASRPYWPIGWSADGRAVLAQDDHSIHTLAADGTGPVKPPLVLPWWYADCTAAARRHPETFFCTVTDYVADAWMIEGFDPDVR